MTGPTQKLLSEYQDAYPCTHFEERKHSKPQISKSKSRPFTNKELEKVRDSADVYNFKDYFRPPFQRDTRKLEDYNGIIREMPDKGT